MRSKRAALRWLGATLLACGARVADAASQKPEWSTATSTRPSDGRVIVYRFRSVLGNGIQRAAYPDRVTIVWKYESANGLPSKEAFAAMNRMEDLLLLRVEGTSLAILALVSTGNDLREWVYYTRSQQDFMAAMNLALRGRPRFPVEIDLARDAQWSYFDTFVKNLRH